MKRERISIKWNIFLYLLVFMAVLLAVLWLLEVCYLDAFYKFVRIKAAGHVKEEVIRLLTGEGDDLAGQLDLIAARNNMAVYIADTGGNVRYNAEYIATSRLNTIPKQELDAYYNLAKENGGSAEISFHGNRRKRLGEPPGRNIPPKEEGVQAESETIPEGEAPPEENGPWAETPPFIQNHGLDHAESVIYVTVFQTGGEELIFLLNCMLTPVGATVYTLKIELGFISVLMLLFAALLAFIIARKVSKPMIRVSESAKALAKGQYDVSFEGRDYKEIAALNATLSHMAEELGKTEQFRRELIANVSHDLRTPLTMITAYAEAMRDLPGENTPENIQVIIEEAMRLTGLVNDMLDLSKLQAGVLKLSSARYNLTEGIRGVLRRYNKLVEQEGFRIQFEYGEDAWILADAFKIEQVVYNLVGNAVHYTGEDKTVIVRQDVCGDRVRILVSDSGEGIGKEELPYIWDRYYKTHKSHKRPLKGTGLGLAIVKHILELHHASYGVESKAGTGSVFWFEIECAERNGREDIGTVI